MLLIVGCSKVEGKDDGEMKKRKITIQIIDNKKEEQRYAINISTNGKQTKNIAILPQNKFLITDKNKETSVQVYDGVEYQLKVFKTHASSIEELQGKPKKGQTETEKPEIDKPLAQLSFTPTKDMKILKVKVEIK